MTQQTAVIGHPIEHSLSPLMHNAVYKVLGLDFNYSKIDVEPRGLKPWMEGDAKQLKGFNVTVPHKVRMLKFATQVDPLVHKVGAANTMINGNGHLQAFNTDVFGFLEALNQDLDIKPGGKNVFVLGAGGAARAVCVALLENGADCVSIANRTLVYAKDLQEELREFYPKAHLEAYVLNSMNLLRAIEQADLIVQCTSVGMTPHVELSPMENFVTIHSKQAVMDLIYSPSETLFMKKCKERGAQVTNGLSMLVYQAAQAFELMTGQRCDAQIMFDALKSVGHLPPETWARQHRVPLQDQAGDPHANDPASFTGKH